MAQLRIEHDHAEGTRLTGNVRGDGVYEIVIACWGWRWGRYKGLHIQASADKDAQRHKIDPLVARLEAAGHSVEVVVDDTPRPVAQVEADRAARAEARTERAEQLSAAAEQRAGQARHARRQIAGGIPLGQPILLGHHSEGRARRDVARMDSLDRRQRDELGKADHYAGRAEGAQNRLAERVDPRVTMRRIEGLEADRRRWRRELDEAKAANSLTRAAQCAREMDRLTEEIDHWRAHLTALAARGEFVAWQPEDFAKGDLARVRGSWYAVARVNRKSVSVLNRFHGDSGRATPVSWDEITGRRRGGQQWDTPHGQPWPVELAEQVTRWAYIVHRGALAEREYDDAAVHTRLRVRQTWRIVFGLPAHAATAEVEACREAVRQQPVDRQRELAAACLAVHERLAGGESEPVVRASTSPFPVEPAWRMPEGEPVDRRADHVRPGDVVVGVWDRGFAGADRRLLRRFCGPVERAHGPVDYRELGRLTTITLIDGTAQEFGESVWLSVHPDPHECVPVEQIVDRGRYEIVGRDERGRITCVTGHAGRPGPMTEKSKGSNGRWTERTVLAVPMSERPGGWGDWRTHVYVEAGALVRPMPAAEDGTEEQE